MVIWVDEVPEIGIDGDGVRIIIYIDGRPKAFRTSRAWLRNYIRTAERVLDDAERQSQDNLVGLHGVCPFAKEDRCH